MPLTVHDCQKIVKSVADMTVIAGWYSKFVLEGRIYRGHTNYDWPLVPKVDREGFDKWMILDEQQASAKIVPRTWEGAMLQFFKDRAVALTDFQPTSSIEWLALAQHHGMITRLLDWTDNALAALYFAVEDAKNIKTDSAVYALAPDHMKHLLGDGENPLEIKDVRLYRPRHISRRIVTQASIFSVHPPNSDVDSEAWQGDLMRVRIPRQSRPLIRRQLDELGFNRFTMFPDLSGLGEWLNRVWGGGEGLVDRTIYAPKEEER